jgi:cytochrome oxidase Cu insertion factor (SCO1/SenC/PrrC family)
MTAWVVRHPILATFVPLALFVASGGALIALQASRRAAIDTSVIDDFGPVGSFAFIDKDERTVRDADLKGKVWIVACFFTCCTESCPQLSGAMARLQSELAGESDIRLVSLTVDPAHDTPQKLAQYAENYQANGEKWLFLRGNEEDVHRFVMQQLKLGVGRNDAPDATPGSRMIHSDKLTLVDRRGVIRGYFLGTDPAQVNELKLAAGRLAREK